MYMAAHVYTSKNERPHRRLHHQEGHHYSEQMAAHLIKKMVGALRYCHDHHIAHRDLKLENFLFEVRFYFTPCIYYMLVVAVV